MMRSSKHRGGERGTELVETAFSLFVFLLLLLGIMDFGRAVYEYHFVSSAARQAARWASVRGSTCTGLTGGCPASAADVQTYVRNTLASGGSAGYDAGKITATTTWPKNTPNCPASGASNAPLCDVQVVVSYNFAFILLPRKLIASLPGTFTMSSTSDMIISQ
jgi:Flp pilus assembly protein TadG